jgi:hypothetical protein
VPGPAEGVEPRGHSDGLRGPWASGGGGGGGALHAERGRAEAGPEVRTKVSAEVRTARAAAVRRLAQAELAQAELAE